jgi:hypothetical protein
MRLLDWLTDADGSIAYLPTGPAKPSQRQRIARWGGSKHKWARRVVGAHGLLLTGVSGVEVGRWLIDAVSVIATPLAITAALLGAALGVSIMVWTSLILLRRGWGV